MQDAQRFLAARSRVGWIWHFGLALAAYPLIYVFFGLLVAPFPYSFYTQGSFGLAAPTWGRIIPVQIARSPLLLIGVSPLLANWMGSRRDPYLSLVAALWVLAGLLWTLISFWMEPGMRLAHTPEALADATIYVGDWLHSLLPVSQLRPPKSASWQLHRGRARQSQSSNRADPQFSTWRGARIAAQGVQAKQRWLQGVSGSPS